MRQQRHWQSIVSVTSSNSTPSRHCTPESDRDPVAFAERQEFKVYLQENRMWNNLAESSQYLLLRRKKKHEKEF